MLEAPTGPAPLVEEPADSAPLVPTNEAKSDPFVQDVAPPYGVQTACPRWLANLCGKIASAATIENMRGESGQETGKTTDDEPHNRPLTDAPDSVNPHGQAHVPVDDCADDDMPALLSSDDDTSDDSDDDVEEMYDQATSPAVQKDNKQDPTNDVNAVAMMAFSPKTLTEVDNLLLDLPTEADAPVKEKKSEASEEIGQQTTAAPASSSATTTASRQREALSGSLILIKIFYRFKALGLKKFLGNRSPTNKSWMKTIFNVSSTYGTHGTQMHA
eukprot:g29753.t1